MSALAAVLVAAHAGSASGQSFNSMTGSQAQISPVAPESNGIDIGAGRLHPSIQLDTHYVVNPGRLPEESPQRNNDVYFAVRPGFDLSIPSSRLELNAGGSVEYQKYLDADEYSSFAGLLNAGALINKEGMLTVNVSDTLVRTSQPGLQSSSEEVTGVPTVVPVGEYRLASWSNQAALAFDLKPGGGALIVTLGYTNFYINYDDGAVANDLLDHMRHTPALRASWKFLPKTSVFIEGSGQLSSFNGSNADPYIVEAVAGMNGTVTNKLTALLKLGYSFPFNTPDPGGTIVGQLEGTWRATDTTSLRVGAVRSYQPVPFFQYVNLTRPYLRLEQAFGARLTLIVAAQYSYLDYASTTDATVTGGGPERIDNDISATVGLNFHATEFFTISVVNAFDFRSSNQEAPLPATVTGLDPLPFDYTANDTVLRLSFRY